ncbi:hypothetical protein SCLCIDRAFT_29331 [Scleroderma citrinum Foug A]|uniref:Uncharacterized protein n=1 Tax=Scleroderma citrinum Foug A TaxID=1036808 RepID=A0A0C3DKG5_9AGAM|nr:hypothetical protein SCLCIDRAFT_29331 [Scleroderma citrinum Foug A]
MSSESTPFIPIPRSRARSSQAKASNSVISQQSRSLEELRRVIEVSKQEVMAEAQAEMHKQIQRVQVEKENELLKLRDHYETLAHLKEVLHKVLAVVPRHCPLRHQYWHEEGYSVYGLRMMGLHHGLPDQRQRHTRQALHPDKCPAHHPSDRPAPPSPSADLNDNYIEKIAKHVYGFMEKRSPTTPKRQSKKDVLWEQVQADLERNQNMAHVRELFKEVFRVNQDEDFISGPLVSIEEVQSFSENLGPGPDPLDLRWDFRHPTSSDWNQAVIVVLMEQLSEMCEREAWTTLPKSDEYWKAAITEKYGRIKVDSMSLHCKDDSSLEMLQEATMRAMQEKNTKLKKTRRAMCHRDMSSFRSPKMTLICLLEIPLSMQGDRLSEWDEVGK